MSASSTEPHAYQALHLGRTVADWRMIAVALNVAARYSPGRAGAHMRAMARDIESQLPLLPPQ